MVSTINSLLFRSNIETNKQFQRLSEKTQVVMPENGQNEVVKNRLTHSYEVATSSLLIAANIARMNNVFLQDIDYRESLSCCSLLHDIGHCSFGHDGAYVLNKFFLKLGVKDGFSDNNNNLVVIDKNNIVVSDYIITSVIKYPENLYDFQVNKYIPLLKTAIKEDAAYYTRLGFNLKNQKTTISCQVMDEADRNSYTCSDICDFLCLGNIISLYNLQRAVEIYNLPFPKSDLNELAIVIKSCSKTNTKAYFNSLKNRFNCNYKLSNDGIVVIDKILENYREFLSFLCAEFFIKSIRCKPIHLHNISLLKSYIKDVVAGRYSPSDYYSNKINACKTENEKYTYMRDMIAEVSDWYILKYQQKAKVKK